MHGRKKTGIAPSAEETEAVSSKVAAYQKLANKLLGARNQIKEDPTNALKQVGVDILPLQAQLLKVNPDFYTLWNHRRELLLAQQVQQSSSSAIDATELKTRIRGVKKQSKPFTRDVLENELGLTASCIKKQPKSYGAWYHRLWIIEGHVSMDGASAEVNEVLQGELQLCAQFLELDQRNFHCWTYRKAIATMAQVSDDDEMDYTMEKIEQNFSNYSAFHYRSKVLESCLLKYANTDTIVKGLNKVEVVRSELEMVCQAAFTEPEDQSAWWYHRFVLDWAERALIDKQSLSEFKQMLENEMLQLKELRDSDTSYKWAHVTLANTNSCYRRTLIKLASDDAAMSGLQEQLDGLKGEYGDIITTLIDLDKSRAGYYKALLAKDEQV